MLAVLLVCTGNICRTPMAEGFLRDRSDRLLGGALSVTSAGVWARTGKPPTDEAIIAARERGADISALRSTPFSPRLAESVDLILTMTEEQRSEVLEQAPQAEPKTFTLKELVALLGELGPPDGPTPEAMLERIEASHRLRRGPRAPTINDSDVGDPLGLAVEAYRATAWELEGLIDELVDGLARPAARRAEA